LRRLVRAAAVVAAGVPVPGGGDGVVDTLSLFADGVGDAATGLPNNAGVDATTTDVW